MQEHIRRAHPEHYISKLPATEESFHLMISTAPSDRPPQPQPNPASQHLGQAKGHSHGYHLDNASNPGTPRNHLDDYPGGSLLPAAAALAQLHNHKTESTWDSEPVGFSSDTGSWQFLFPTELTSSASQEWHSDNEGGRFARSSIELPPLHLNNNDITSFPSFDGGPRPRDVLPSILANSPPGRSSTLPPLHKGIAPNRPRKQSVTKRSHQRKKSKGAAADWLRRLQNDGPDYLRPGGADRKALSAEPAGVDFGKRWEDLIDAAASATEGIDEDRTPVRLFSPTVYDHHSGLTPQVPQSPVSIQRGSMPPFPQHSFQSYQASPLQQALTPPSYNPEAPDPFPSVESGESGENFHIESRGLSDSSPSYSSQNTQIYCAACQGVSFLRESYACTECICGLCQACVDVLMGEQGARRKCPRCATIGGRFKPFQLDIR
jgi:hypothetical protein